MRTAILLQVEQHVRELFEKSLDKRMYYHNFRHTEQVVHQARLLAESEQLSAADTQIVLIAEWFHDAGFTVSYDRHEASSADIAVKFLIPLLSSEEITKVVNCILATRKGTLPEDQLQAIMHDADYYHFFGTHYFELLNDLRAELEAVPNIRFSNEEWFAKNAAFLSQHRFYTTSYQEQWPQQKVKLLAENRRQLALATPITPT